MSKSSKLRIHKSWDARWVIGVVVGAVVLGVGIFLLVKYAFPSKDSESVDEEPTEEPSPTTPTTTTTTTTTTTPTLLYVPDCKIAAGLTAVGGADTIPAGSPNVGSIAVTDDGATLLMVTGPGMGVSGGYVRVYSRNDTSYTLGATRTYLVPPDLQISSCAISPQGTHEAVIMRNSTVEPQTHVCSLDEGALVFTDDSFTSIISARFVPGSAVDESDLQFYLVDSTNVVSQQGRLRWFQYNGSTFEFRQALSGGRSGDNFAYAYDLATHVQCMAVVDQSNSKRVLLYTRATVNDDWVIQTDLTLASNVVFSVDAWGNFCKLSPDGLILVLCHAFATGLEAAENDGAVEIYKRSTLTSAFSLTQVLRPQAEYIDQYFGVYAMMRENLLVIPCGDVALTQRHSEVFTMDHATGTATFLEGLPWSFELSEASSSVSVPGLALFTDSVHMYALFSYSNITGSNGTLVVYRSGCV